MVAFALVEGIVDQSHKAIAGEALAKGLISGRVFAFGVVSARANHAWSRPIELVGNVEVRRHQAVGTAFEDEFFDAIMSPFYGAYNTGVERGFARPGAIGFVDGRTYLVLIGQCLLARADRSQAFCAFAIDGAHLCDIVVEHHVSIAVAGHDYLVVELNDFHPLQWV